MKKYFFLFAMISACSFGLPNQDSSAQDSQGSVPKKGLTFLVTTSVETRHSRFFSAHHAPEARTENSQAIVHGDTVCSVQLPVLCFLDIDAPVPETLIESQNWTGGILALSAKERGDRFSYISEVNAYCAASFGKGWRVANYHDGGGRRIKRIWYCGLTTDSILG